MNNIDILNKLKDIQKSNPTEVAQASQMTNDQKLDLLQSVGAHIYFTNQQQALASPMLNLIVDLATKTKSAENELKVAKNSLNVMIDDIENTPTLSKEERMENLAKIEETTTSPANLSAPITEGEPIPDDVPVATFEPDVNPEVESEVVPEEETLRLGVKIDEETGDLMISKEIASLLIKQGAQSVRRDTIIGLNEASMTNLMFEEPVIRMNVLQDWLRTLSKEMSQAKILKEWNNTIIGK